MPPGSKTTARREGKQSIRATSSASFSPHAYTRTRAARSMTVRGDLSSDQSTRRAVQAANNSPKKTRARCVPEREGKAGDRVESIDLGGSHTVRDIKADDPLDLSAVAQPPLPPSLSEEAGRIEPKFTAEEKGKGRDAPVPVQMEDDEDLQSRPKKIPKKNQTVFSTTVAPNCSPATVSRPSVRSSARTRASPVKRARITRSQSLRLSSGSLKPKSSPSIGSKVSALKTVAPLISPNRLSRGSVYDDGEDDDDDMRLHPSPKKKSVMTPLPTSPTRLPPSLSSPSRSSILSGHINRLTPLAAQGTKRSRAGAFSRSPAKVIPRPVLPRVSSPSGSSSLTRVTPSSPPMVPIVDESASNPFYVRTPTPTPAPTPPSPSSPSTPCSSAFVPAATKTISTSTPVIPSSSCSVVHPHSTPLSQFITKDSQTNTSPDESRPSSPLTPLSDLRGFLANTPSSASSSSTLSPASNHKKRSRDDLAELSFVRPSPLSSGPNSRKLKSCLLSSSPSSSPISSPEDQDPFNLIGSVGSSGSSKSKRVRFSPSFQEDKGRTNRPMPVSPTGLTSSGTRIEGRSPLSSPPSRQCAVIAATADAARGGLGIEGFPPLMDLKKMRKKQLRSPRKRVFPKSLDDDEGGFEPGRDGGRAIIKRVEGAERPIPFMLHSVNGGTEIHCAEEKEMEEEEKKDQKIDPEGSLEVNPDVSELTLAETPEIKEERPLPLSLPTSSLQPSTASISTKPPLDLSVVSFQLASPDSSPSSQSESVQNAPSASSASSAQSTLSLIPFPSTPSASRPRTGPIPAHPTLPGVHARPVTNSRVPSGPTPKHPSATSSLLSASSSESGSAFPLGASKLSFAKTSIVNGPRLPTSSGASSISTRSSNRTGVVGTVGKLPIFSTNPTGRSGTRKTSGPSKMTSGNRTNEQTSVASDSVSERAPSATSLSSASSTMSSSDSAAPSSANGAPSILGPSKPKQVLSTVVNEIPKAKPLPKVPSSGVDGLLGIAKEGLAGLSKSGLSCEGQSAMAGLAQSLAIMKANRKKSLERAGHPNGDTDTGRVGKDPNSENKPGVGAKRGSGSFVFSSSRRLPPIPPPLTTSLRDSRLNSTTEPSNRSLTTLPSRSIESTASGNSTESNVSLTSSKCKSSIASIRGHGTSKALAGVVAFVDVRTAEGDDAGGVFVEMLKELGAKVLKAPSDSVTHIIYKAGKTSTLTFYRRSVPLPTTIPENSTSSSVLDESERDTSVASVDGSRNLSLAEGTGSRVKKLVCLMGIGWVIRCREEKRWVEEEEYKILPEDQDEFTKRRKSMEPKHLLSHPSTTTSNPFSISLEKARKKSMQFAPRVSSPLKRAFKAHEGTL